MLPIQSEQDLKQLRRSVATYAALCAWQSQGIFDRLAHSKTPQSAASLAMDERALEITGAVMAHLGLAQQDAQGAWSLTARGAQLQHEGALERTLSQPFMQLSGRLDETLRDGGPLEITEGGVVEADPERSRRFMEMLYRSSAQSVEEVARALTPHVEPGLAVLDLGGGHGRYGHTLSQRLDARVTLVDKEVCIALARERYADSQQYLAGDFMTMDLGGPYDLALLSNIVHGFGPAENQQIFSQLASCVRPGGLVVLKDMFLDERSGGSEVAAVFGVQMLLCTREGRSYSRRAMADLLDVTGFDWVDAIEVPSCNFSLLLARRRSSS